MGSSQLAFVTKTLRDAPPCAVEVVAVAVMIIVILVVIVVVVVVVVEEV